MYLIILLLEFLASELIRTTCKIRDTQCLPLVTAKAKDYKEKAS